MTRNTTCSKSAAASVSPSDGEAWLKGLDPLSLFFSVYLGCWQWDPVPVLLGSQKALQNRCCRHVASLIIWFRQIYSREAKLDVCTGLMCSPANEYISFVLIAAEIVLKSSFSNQSHDSLGELISLSSGSGLESLPDTVCWTKAILADRGFRKWLTRTHSPPKWKTHQTSDSVLTCKQTGKKQTNTVSHMDFVEPSC